MPSVLLRPLSLAAVRLGAASAAGALVSMLKFRATLSADQLPARSKARARKV
jgi:hypothetical protein